MYGHGVSATPPVKKMLMFRKVLQQLKANMDEMMTIKVSTIRFYIARKLPNSLEKIRICDYISVQKE